MGAACCSDNIARADGPPAPASQGKPASPHTSAASRAAPQGGHGPAASTAAAAAPQGGGGGGQGGVDPEIFISQVAELPRFDKQSRGRGDEDSASSVGTIKSVELDGVSDVVDAATSKEQRQQAKAVVKEFVKEMVKGKKMNVMTQSGQLKSCSASLNRSLDTFSIKVGTQKRSIKLKDIEEIHAGDEQIEGVTTPLDDLCATLMLKSDDCITFRLADVNSRDTFVMCLLMFCNNQK